MDPLNIASFVNALCVRRKSQPSSSAEMEWAAKEADRKHREKAREYKYQKITEQDIWLPSRLRIRKQHSNTSETEEPPVSPTTIKWADHVIWITYYCL